MTLEASNKPLTAVIIGAGNVALHLGNALHRKGVKVSEVFNRTESSGKALSTALESEFVSDISQISSKADYYFICVKDDAIASVAQQMPETTGIVVHTSGSISADVLNRFQNFGVFYPLQTFSKNKAEVDFSAVPLFVESGNKEVLNKIRSLAERLTENVIEVEGEQRRVLHLSAVFACNFTNYMMSIAEELLEESKLDFSLLHPLIAETFKKAELSGPKQAQTGPAKRNDRSTLEMHLEMLKGKEDLKEIYRLLSAGILQSFGK
jgi:predicted short-subunit dehydrogenase-like oxidoreductase (DUF2520 family)